MSFCVCLSFSVCVSLCLCSCSYLHLSILLSLPPMRQGTMYLRLATNFLCIQGLPWASDTPAFTSTGITSLYHHGWFQWCLDRTQDLMHAKWALYWLDLHMPRLIWDSWSYYLSLLSAEWQVSVTRLNFLFLLLYLAGILLSLSSSSASISINLEANTHWRENKEKK